MSVSDEIIKLVDAFAERFGVAVDWSSENVLPYLENLAGRYIKYEIAVSAVIMILAAIVLIGGLTYLHKHKDFGVIITHYNYIPDDEDRFVRILAYALIITIPTIAILIGIFEIIPCIFLPEKVILEELLALKMMM